MIQSLELLNPNPIYGYLNSEHLVYNLTTKNLIGRSPQCDIILNHPSVSKEQAKIEFDIDKEGNCKGGYIEDLNSQEGTCVNNVKLLLNQRIKLNEGDNITFGKDNMIYNFSYQNNKKSERKFQIKDNKISLVNESNYQNATVNHFSHVNCESPKFNIPSNDDVIKEEINYNNNSNNYIEEGEEEATLKDTNNFCSNNFNNNNSLINNIQPQSSSLYQEIYKQNNLLDVKIKEKTNELSNLTSLYNQLNDKFNKLNAKHNALMIYASEIQKKNDSLDLALKEKESKISTFESQPLTKQIKEKDSLISHLQSENEIYKKELEKIKKSLLDNSSPFSISDNLNKLCDEYLKENVKYKQIIQKYIEYETECTKKWNELLNTNESLNNKMNSMRAEWKNDIDKYNSIIEANDKRMNCALAQIPKNFDKFNIKKEEAAKFLVEQMNIYIKEKANLLKENSTLNKKMTDLSFENEKLKDEILKNELKLRNNDNKELLNKIDELEDLIRKYKETYSAEKIIDYESMIVRMDLQIKEKDNLINEYKSKLDNIMKNQNFLNFDDREIVNSVSQALKDKDNVIKNLKDKLIDISSGNINDPLLKNKDNNI